MHAKFDRQQQRYSPYWAGRAELEHSKPVFRLPRWLAILIFG